MPPAARITDMHVCPMVTGLVPHVGGPVMVGSPTVLIGFMPAARTGDQCICVGPPDTIIKGSATVDIAYKKAARLGDQTAHGGTIVVGCPTVLIGDMGGGGGGGGAGGTDAATATIAGFKDCPDAPSVVSFEPELDKQFDDRWNNSFPDGKSQEQGGTLVRNEDGSLSMINTNPPGLNSGSFPVDRTTGPGQTVVGVFHTHPYDASEGGHTGVSLSGGDAAYMINNGDQMIIAQSGDEQFMYLRTSKTPKNVDFNRLNDAQNARVAQLQTKGHSFSEASKIAAKETAQKYGLAYYEGKDGVFHKVSC